MTPRDPQSDSVVTPLRGDIAITGMSCLFAGSPDLDTFWSNILSKVDAVSDPTPDDWDPTMFYDPTSRSNDRLYCKKGGYIGNLARFRPMDYGIMPVTVDGGEPDQWLALRVAFEALADAGYSESPKEHLRTEVILGKGTYINRGNMTVGYHGMLVDYFLRVLKNLEPGYTESQLSEVKRELKAGLPPFNADTAPGLIGNIIAGRVANRLDLMGPSFTVDAACASALLAIEIGVRDLLTHKCDLVLAGGANVNAPLPTLSLFCQLGALSRREQIRPFDKNADGTILGEGLGMIVLKRREDAERDGDRVYALIKGVGVASDGRAMHVMAPRIEGEELAVRRAYEMAGLPTDTVGLVEAHGTATPVGDMVEVQALSRVFGERKQQLPSCALGSVKSMIGHTMPAAGIAGVIKSALALYHRVLPPTINCDEPNPALNLDKTPFYINTEARPWIQGTETPRRAGINSFGFGGINAHVVLEEHPLEAPQAKRHLVDWDTEVCILKAESREKLIARASRLRAYLQGCGEVPLKDIAFTLNTQLVDQASWLAIIASSKEDLAQKIDRAIARLSDTECQQIKDNAGIYFFEPRLQGKVAFLFPGEGAQYRDMLLDLCLHFPEVRACFDGADRALRDGDRSVLPSEFIFPRTILPESERQYIEKALWEIDGAVEAVLIGNWAIWTLLQQLKIRPDVIAGHSTGDYSAMFASNIVDTEKAIFEFRNVNRSSRRIATPEAMLLAIAADTNTVNSIIETVGGDLCLAMSNCPHQNVVAVSKALADPVIEELRKRAIIYEILPFDRPYHTAMFHEYAEEAGKVFFSQLAVSPPAIETYSCTTAARYPTQADEIRRLFVAHWEQPVLFTETISQMYEDGVRIFVEAGPRGNLTAFVGDILRGKPHLAMPANVARRSGITQINHLAGVLAAQGVPIRLDYLYARRDPKVVAWENVAVPVKKQPEAMKLFTALPSLKISPRQPKPVSSVSSSFQDSPLSPLSDIESPRPILSSISSHSVARGSAAVAHTPVVAAPVSPVASASIGTADHVMKEYLKGMDAFLEVEKQVMGALLTRLGRTSMSNGAVTAIKPRTFPMLGKITSLTPDQELIAIRELNVKEDIFLRDHALGGCVSTKDSSLMSLMVVPLTMSMEILAEAGAALMPDDVLIEMHDIKAHHWIQVDEIVHLEIKARKVNSSPNQVAVEVRSLGATGQSDPALMVEGIMVFGNNYPVPPKASTDSLVGEHPSRLAETPLYDGRVMFHGPCFQGVVSVDRSGENGVIGILRTLPANGLFQSDSEPRFVTDPVVLDAAGQLVGYWAAEHLQNGFVVFPYHLESLRIYGPKRPAGELCRCRVMLQLHGNEAMRSDIEVVGAEGTVWMQFKGWADRRFDPPQRFHKAWITPHESTMSDEWPTPVVGFDERLSIDCYRLKSIFESGGGLWKELWASLVLSQQERKTFRELRGPERRQMEWLHGRTVAKDAVRGFLRSRYGLSFLPADIEIVPDEYGKPSAIVSWTDNLPKAFEISLAHTDGMAVALVGEKLPDRSLGIDVQVIRDLSHDFEAIALSEDERRLIDNMDPEQRNEWLFRCWCAKESISKALGRGLIEGPASVRVMSLNLDSGIVQATPRGKLAEVVAGAAGAQLKAFTTRDGNFVVATALYEMEHYEHGQ